VDSLQAEESYWAAGRGRQQGGIMTKRISANRRNAKKSTGPNNTTSTRFNATKHGLLAAGITELDDADEYQNTLSRLNQAYLAELETFLLERIALTMIRLRRSARLEAEYITDVLNPPIYGEAHESVGMALFERPLIDPGLPAAVNSEKFEPLVKIFQRYDTALENKLFRAMHEVERLRRMRLGEQLPAPVAVDVSVHTDPRELDSFAECADKVLEGSLSEPPDKRESINSKTAPSEAATSLDLNVEADAGGLPSFLQPSEKESLGGSEFKPPDRVEDLNSQVVPENGEATETSTDE
jgi:hypothetical protein